ncbi:MAG: putative selenium-dependent hydroxylase accessory protein YqeC [Anaerolineae bacterium]|nr:putative selenium-dependent hydroxylase accessory protein YqeC [Anaerolineae bacterium]
MISMEAVFSMRPGEVWAITGSGGKTSLLFRLAQLACRQFGAALVSHSAHLALGQAEYADHVYLHELPGPDTILPRGINLVTGAVLPERQRYAGLERDDLLKLKAVAVANGVPLLIEADGSRGKPLKAWAEWEPPIPDFTDRVVVVAGMSGIGAQLSDTLVFRSERFAALAGLTPGEVVSVAAVSRALCSVDGGLKNIPDTAERVVVLNQADTPDAQAASYALGRLLLAQYAQVAGVSLHGCAGAPSEMHFLLQPTAGIVLAAGASRRMGRAKQLLDWQGEPLVRRAARTLLEGGCSPVIVVTGWESEAVPSALAGLDLRVVNNERWQDGQSTSVAAGINAVPPGCGAAIFLPCDQPYAGVDVIQALVELHAFTQADAVCPRVGNERVSPTLFSRRWFGALNQLVGDAGGRQLLGQLNLSYVDWADERLTLDLDEPEDLTKTL